MKLRLAIIASGRGSNAAALHTAIIQEKLNAELVLILSNVPGAKVLDFARTHKIPYWARSHKGIPRETFDEAMVEAMHGYQVDTVVLAGYMRLVTPRLLNAFPGRVLNIHPALLPSFPGSNGAADALAYGVRITGASVHFVDEGMDSGPIIIQGATAVLPDDDETNLLKRIHRLEHTIYAQALQWLAEKRLELRERKVYLLPKKQDPSGASSPSARTCRLQAENSSQNTPQTQSTDLYLISPPLGS